MADTKTEKGGSPAGPLAQAVKSGAQIGSTVIHPLPKIAAVPVAEPRMDAADNQRLKVKTQKLLVDILIDRKYDLETRAGALRQLMSMVDTEGANHIGKYCFSNAKDQTSCQATFVPIFMNGLTRFGDRTAADILLGYLDLNGMDKEAVSRNLFESLSNAQFPSWSVIHLEKLMLIKIPSLLKHLRQPIAKALQVICQREFESNE